MALWEKKRLSNSVLLDLRFIILIAVQYDKNGKEKQNRNKNRQK